METEIWEITIYCDNGPAYNILGDENTLMAELMAWQGYQKSSTEEFEEHQASFGETYSSTLGHEIRVINGYSHNVARHPAVLGYRFNEVQGMTMMRVA